MSHELLILVGCGTVGARIAGLLRMPMWAITGSILGSATGNLILAAHTTMPSWLTFVAQVLIGSAVGASVQPGLARQLGSVIVPTVVVVFSIVVVALSGSALLTYFHLAGPIDAVLGMLPGGVGEMVAASASVGGDGALVAGLHLVRLLLVIWTLPLLVRWAGKWKRRGERDAPGEQPTT